ncbi:MAG: protein kinase [Leuconostoc sp.]|nr:protein kinase [Leuconostoc sp.]
MSQYVLDLIYTITNCLSCFPGSPTLKINSRSFKILRLLGEGGFSYVYLVQDTSNEALYALKKIRCPFGQESVAQAMKEVEAYALFQGNRNIIKAIDHCIESDRSDPSAKTVYILLPYYRRGNLQDVINANLVNGTKFPERKLMGLFLGVCRALEAMHEYKVGGGGKNKARQLRREANQADADARQARMGGRDDNDENEMLEPLMDDEVTQSQEGVAVGGVRAYAHRDIKPGKLSLISLLSITILTEQRQHNDRRRRHLPNPNGSRLPATLTHPRNLPLPRPRNPRPSRRAQHHALPRTRTLRRQNRVDNRHKSRHLVTRVHTIRLPSGQIPI